MAILPHNIWYIVVIITCTKSFDYDSDMCFQQQFFRQCNCSCVDQCEHPNICCKANDVNMDSIREFQQYFSCVPQMFSPFLIVTKCPDDWPIQTIRSLCEEPTSSTPEEINPVNVEFFGSEITFRNKYCAICHSQMTYTYSAFYVIPQTCPVIVTLFLPHLRNSFGMELLWNDVALCDKYLPDSTSNVANHCSCHHPLGDFTNQEVRVHMIYDSNDDVNPFFTPNCSNDLMMHKRVKECDSNIKTVNDTCHQVIAVNRCLDVFTFVSTFDVYANGYLQNLNEILNKVVNALLKMYETLHERGLGYLVFGLLKYQTYRGNKESGDNCTAVYSNVIFARPDDKEMLKLEEVFHSCACNIEFLSTREQTANEEICEIDKSHDYTARLFDLETAADLCGAESNVGIADVFPFVNKTGCDSRIHASHMIVMTCPNRWMDERIRQLCENPIQNSLDELIPVTASVNSTVLSVTFRNKFCAICHDHLHYKTVPIIVSAEDCNIDKFFNSISLTNISITDTIRSFILEKQCDIYVFTGDTDLFTFCPCPPTDQDVLSEIFLDESANSSPNLECPKIKKNGMPKWRDCGYGYVKVNGECRRLFQPNVCLVNYRFIYQILTLNGIKEDMIKEVTNQFYLSVDHPELVYTSSDYVIVPGLTKQKKKCVEIYIDVLFYQPLNDDQQKAIDTFVQFPCPAIGKCTVTFLPVGHILLNRFCDASPSLSHNHNTNSSSRVNSTFFIIIFTLLLLVQNFNFKPFY